MSHPKAYVPQSGYQYQILCRHPAYNGREWEHCDYAATSQEKAYLLKEYRMAYPAGYEFKSILLPEKYWRTSPSPNITTGVHCPDALIANHC